MIKSLLATFLLITTLLFTGCTTPIAGLQGYTSGSQGYQFLYPKGWTQVDVKKVAGVDVVFHDKNVIILPASRLIIINSILLIFPLPKNVGRKFKNSLKLSLILSRLVRETGNRQ